MAFITKDLLLNLDDVQTWETQRAERINTYKSIYTQNTAQELIDAASNFHWLHPQITASLILNGANYLVQDAATHAAEKMADAGLSPADRVTANRRLKGLTKSIMDNL
jgi:hypothetical protein